MSAGEVAVVEAPARAEGRGLVNWPAALAIGVWSGMSPFAKWALEEFPTLAYTAYRPIIAALLIFGYLIVRREPVLIARGDLRRVALIGVCGTGMSQLFYIAGLANTSVSHSAILGACCPLIAAAYHLMFKRERPDMRSSLGIAGGFAGVVVLVSAARGANGASLLGDGLSLVAATAWVGATIWPVKLFAKYGILRTTAWILASSLLLIVPVSALSMADSLRHPPSAAAWGSLVYSAVFGIMIGNSLWQRAVQEVGPRRTLVYLYLEPVGAIALAALFLGERLSPVQAVGAALALAGVALVNRTTG